MKVLLLGESGSMGASLADRTAAWGNTLPGEIARLTGEQPEFVHVRFFVSHGEPLEFLERQLEQGPFDVVVLSQSKVGFTVWSVHNRVRKVLGNRVGNWLQHGVDIFDNTTRKPGDEGVRRKVNRAVHRSARKVIGQSPTLSAQALTEMYLRVLARLARLEDTQVVILASSHVSALLAKQHPQIVAETEAFREAIRAEAERRRFDWVDRIALMDGAGGDRERLFLDGLHKSDEVHSLISAALAEAVAARAGTRAGASLVASG